MRAVSGRVVDASADRDLTFRWSYNLQAVDPVPRRCAPVSCNIATRSLSRTRLAGVQDGLDLADRQHSDELGRYRKAIALLFCCRFLLMSCRNGFREPRERQPGCHSARTAPRS